MAKSVLVKAIVTNLSENWCGSERKMMKSAVFVAAITAEITVRKKMSLEYRDMTMQGEDEIMYDVSESSISM